MEHPFHTQRNALGNEIRRRREALFLTRVELGQRSGLSPNYIGSIEKGRRDPGLSAICQLASGLGVPLSDLLGGPANLAPSALEAGKLLEHVSEEIQEGVLRLLRSVQPAKAPRRGRGQ